VRRKKKHHHGVGAFLPLTFPPRATLFFPSHQTAGGETFNIIKLLIKESKWITL
jgi:hypothetical protein